MLGPAVAVDGLTLGLVLGLREGLIDGNCVGLPEGAVDGDSLGAADGDADGLDELGEALGAFDGAKVGTVGCADGAGVGIAVGGRRHAPSTRALRMWPPKNGGPAAATAAAEEGDAPCGADAPRRRREQLPSGTSSSHLVHS